MALRARSAKKRLGFSLIELAVALAIGSVSLIVAAEVAKMATRQSGRGEQLTALGQTARLVARQIRADLKVAGYGSTGAVGVDNARAPWATMAVATAGGFFAIPAAIGANNLLGGAIGGAAVLVGSDAIELVVPNPATLTRLTIPVPQGTPLNNASGTPAPAAPPVGCGFYYLADHSAANGAGKTQIFQAGDILQFDAQPGSELMCARVSIYFTDNLGNLHRLDLLPQTPVVQLAGSAGSVFSNGNTSLTSILATDVLDLQFSYMVSAELFANPGGQNPGTRWAFDMQDLPDAAGNLIDGPPRGWFEVREARINMLVRAGRPVEDPNAAQPITEPPLEDSAVVVPDRSLARAFGRVRVTTSEILQNLKLFDLNVNRGIPAEPYSRCEGGGC